MISILKLEIIGLSGLLLAIAGSIAYGATPLEFAESVGANKELSVELEDACRTAIDPLHCFGIGLSISNAETRMGNTKSSHGYFGRVASKDKSAKGFVGSYNRMYAIPEKYNEGGMFYGYGPNNPAPTRYCLSEVSSNSQGHCPNGRASFNKIYDAYKKEVMNKIDEPQTIKKIKQEDKIYVEKRAKKGTPLVKVNKECKQIYTIQQDNSYIQADDYMGRFINRIRGLKKGSKVFFCWDVN